MPHDISRGKQPGQELTGETARSVPAGLATSSYQLTLLHIIETAANDPAGLRRVIYDLARMNLKQEIRVSRPLLTPAKARECLQALETAIARVESDLSRSERIGGSFPQLPGYPLQSEPAEDAIDSMQTLPPPPGSAQSREDGAVPVWLVRSDSEAETRGPIPLRTRERGRWRPGVEVPAYGTDRPQVEIVYPERDHPEAVRLRRRAWRWLMVWPLAQLAGAVVLSAVLYLALTGNLHDAQSPLAAGDEISKRTPSGLPLPSSYGIYAISRGHLSELEALPIKAPDPRVALSAEISEPSKTLLPDGNVVFLVFRRDLLNSAPQKAMIRVVAKMARAMTFNAGKATVTDLTSSWRIRSNSYEFDVAPLSENREMVTIRPETADFALPAGRYALVFNGLAYDFTIDGPVTDRAQCIESVAALNGPVYTDCRQN
jgi:hypothetical protein